MPVLERPPTNFVVTNEGAEYLPIPCGSGGDGAYDCLTLGSPAPGVPVWPVTWDEERGVNLVASDAERTVNNGAVVCPHGADFQPRIPSAGVIIDCVGTELIPSGGGVEEVMLDDKPSGPHCFVDGMPSTGPGHAASAI